MAEIESVMQNLKIRKIDVWQHIVLVVYTIISFIATTPENESKNGDHE